MPFAHGGLFCRPVGAGFWYIEARVGLSSGLSTVALSSAKAEARRAKGEGLAISFIAALKGRQRIARG